MSVSKNPDACPVNILMSLLSGPWTMYILWVLCNSGPTRFGALKHLVEGISSKVLTERLRMLEAAEIIYRQYEPTVPPQVTYGLTERGQELIDVLHQLNALAERWYGSEQREQGMGNGEWGIVTTEVVGLE